MKTTKIILSLVCVLGSASAAMAQKVVDDMLYLTVNENVTTVITASEPVKLVDISTDKIAGDQPISNTIRLKPMEGVEVNRDGDVLGVVTIITERYRAQYALIYTSRMSEAVTDKQIELSERVPYNNPVVSMSTEEMARYSRIISASPAHYRNVATRQHHMKMRLNNIYSIGNYFFLDFSVDNKTNIHFDIDQLHIKLRDKKTTKATTYQAIELTPAFVLEPVKQFRYGYRNVVVIKKLTFPDDKVLTIELSEEQISGRSISMDIDYEDVLAADSFNKSLLYEE